MSTPRSLCKTVNVVPSSAMWQYLNSLNALLASLSKYAETSPEIVKQLLKKTPGKAYVFGAQCACKRSALVRARKKIYIDLRNTIVFDWCIDSRNSIVFNLVVYHIIEVELITTALLLSSTKLENQMS